MTAAASTSPDPAAFDLAGLGAPRPLVDRYPFSPDYERARDLLDRHFPHGHTASTLLGLYRDRLLDVAVIEVEMPRPGTPQRTVTTTRLLLTTPPIATPR